MNSGAEAVETAIKAARKWGYTVKNIPDNQAEIIVAKATFMTLTTTIVGMSSETQYRNGFGPFTPGFKARSFWRCGCTDACDYLKHSCIFVEPIQARPESYFLRRLFKKMR